VINPDGYFLIDKPEGWTSFDCVHFLKRFYGFKKVGHAGSLDPIATGLMVILVNNATRWFDALQKQSKIYETRLLLGVSFDTQDITGTLTEFRPPETEPSEKWVREMLQTFVGETLQTPPAYSALKVRGKPAYTYARQGEMLTLQKRPAFIHNIELLRYRFPEISFHVECKKGFYVRTLCSDLASKLGAAGVLCSLRRLAQSGHKIQEALSLERLPENIAPHLKSL
jgi:tRNA pseudouridine55 synthase